MVQRERCGVFRGNLRDGEVKAQALHPFKEQGKRRAGNPHAAKGGRDGNPIGKAVSLHAVNRDAARMLSVGTDKKSAASGVRFKREKRDVHVLRLGKRFFRGEAAGNAELGTLGALAALGNLLGKEIRMGNEEIVHEGIRVFDEMQNERKLLIGDASHAVRGFKQLGLDDDQRRQRQPAFFRMSLPP